MSNYIKSTDFSAKDSLITGNPNKIIKGSEINDEFNALQTAVATKADLSSPTFLGNPNAPTQAPGNNTNRVATTAFVSGAVVAATGALGTMSTQAASAVAITGGTISGTTVNTNVVGSNSVGARTVSTLVASGGNDDDIWYQY